MPASPEIDLVLPALLSAGFSFGGAPAISLLAGYIPGAALILYFILRNWKHYRERSRDRKRHMEEIANLHGRTIQALALAIEAKDRSTHEHLRRVRAYALGLGERMGLGEMDLQSLRTAAVLHDIGKLAIPEHILLKPGRLTPEEFNTMKIHPVVGAQILEQVQFPYPVVPIVRSHHERWDGAGYPQGLKGAAIPIGARILAAADCFDALVSDRQYRRAMPLDGAMRILSEQSGKAFDPDVIRHLECCYRDLEKKARWESQHCVKLKTDVEITAGGAPANGFAQEIGNKNRQHPPGRLAQRDHATLAPTSLS